MNNVQQLPAIGCASIYCDSRLHDNRKEPGGVEKRAVEKVTILSLMYAFETLNMWMVSGWQVSHECIFKTVI